MNLEWPGESEHSTSINNSPAANLSSLRDATIFALNVSVTLRLLFTGDSLQCFASALPPTTP
jgi:hypothetical protein